MATKELIFHPLIMELFWRQGRQEVERMVRQTLGRFLTVKGKRVEVGPGVRVKNHHSLLAIRYSPGPKGRWPLACPRTDREFKRESWGILEFFRLPEKLV